ncbi:hypothetical protein NP493_718g00014 [Ridgeia piscesae]|uniref:G-protein coupled receptors family 1 profile domain-containing protein n=1 Tax=Ridgeia piscesae TaxID=27915 RepID=A0AAD9NMN6_RIDPI|nr:hypothetical protein NP493_718g00014 [Ridgeia piscesae]
MCMAVSFAFIICVAPVHVFYVTIPNWPMSLHDQYDVFGSLLLLRYANHAINFFLYSLTGAHFRCELDQYDVLGSLLLLRYANHAVNFFLYSLTGAHFRSELVALFRRSSRQTMANDTALMSTASSVLEDVVTSNDSNTGGFVIDVSANIWRYGWPPLCMPGLVGNTLVLLVLRRDGLVRTSANVYLSALAVGDSLVLMVASVTMYPGRAWGWWFDRTSRLVCHDTWPVHCTLVNASSWFIVAFTVERCVVVRSPLRRLSTPRNAGLCCGSLLVLAFVKNIDLFFIQDLVVDTDSGDVICTATLRYRDYVNNYRPMINFVTCGVIPTVIVIVCNWAIIRTLRRDLVQSNARESIVRHTTVMCLAVSFAFIVCVAPAHVFYVNIPNWPMSLHV